MIATVAVLVAGIAALVRTLLEPPPFRIRRLPARRRGVRPPDLTGRFPRPLRVRLQAVGWPPAAFAAVVSGGTLTALLLLPALGATALFLALTVLAVSFWTLEAEYRRWQVEIFRELPVLADLLEIHLAAGDTPLQALAGAASLLSGPLRPQVDRTLARAALGQDFVSALQSLGQVTGRPEMAAVAARLGAALHARTPSHPGFAALSESLRRTAEAEIREASRRMPAVFALIAMVGLFNLALVIGGPILLASLHALAGP
ncbi:type II secretion system F family protein [Caldinitratiruptor microaerophilus]|uniref:Type II secretion system protein GspF domain-containing protein n=1 Tax=Caldinitratiruptor microaerophilus TaxID=671077 RepID=A0AA35CIU8_9FIRM|nr:type II secretion system F family protein [Caldinitratiruptor microaerophilus]BDG59942.1 hypothetical protein caldi_10320 [Caldinitratiruptor microaerophilus]